MKLILEDNDTFYLRSLKNLLESNGIPALINGTHSVRVVTPFLINQQSLWVYFDNQLEEAIKLIDNPEYEVKNKVDITEFNKQKKILNPNKALVHFVLTLCGVIAGLYIIIMVLQWFSV